MQKAAIIVPCYNESHRLQKDAFNDFLKSHPDIDIIFVNDGSTDNTQLLLQELNIENSQQVLLIRLEKNRGKANAVKEGFTAAGKNLLYTHIGYLDADLSTSLEEFYRLYDLIKESNHDFVSGSRIKMLDTKIERSAFRHFTGRIIATIIDSKFNLGIYDTQCGAKWFRKEIIGSICEHNFKTKWLFDVEIFLRLKQFRANGKEVPLKSWKSITKSKINFFSFPIIIRELFLLFKYYR